MVLPISPIVMPTAPTANITPFTYRDGLSYLQRLERIVKYLNNVTKPYIDESYSELAGAFETQVNLVITEVNELVQDIIDGSVEIQDPIVAEMLGDSESDTYEILYALLSNTLIEDPDDEGTFINGLISPPSPAEYAWVDGLYVPVV